MNNCPQCETPLTNTANAQGKHQECDTCHGRLYGIGMLRKLVTTQAISDMWQSAYQQQGRHGRPCPECNNPMFEVRTECTPTPTNVDICTRCTLYWFDTGEFEALPMLPPPPPPPQKFSNGLSDKERERIATIEVEALEHQFQYQAQVNSTPEGWQLIPAVLGFPVKLNERNTELFTTPWLTWGLAAVVTIVSILLFMGGPTAINALGFIPDQAFRYGGLSFLTVFFAHADPMHLIGNMYFLLLFGGGVESRLGIGRFAVLLFLATFAGGVAHMVGDPHSSVPCVGASGGISGVMLYYALAFPRERFAFLLYFRFRFQLIRVPAWAMIAIWVAMQLLTASLQMHGISSVSGLAHLGGAAAGILCWFLWRDTENKNTVLTLDEIGKDGPKSFVGK